MILTPKITLASPMSYISNLDPRNNLVLETISMHVPKINMSSTYKHIMTHSPFSDLEYTHLSTSLGERPLQSNTLSSFHATVLVLVLTYTKILKVFTPYFIDQGHTLQVESYKFPPLIHHSEKQS